MARKLLELTVVDFFFFDSPEVLLDMSRYDCRSCLKNRSEFSGLAKVSLFERAEVLTNSLQRFWSLLKPFDKS